MKTIPLSLITVLNALEMGTLLLSAEQEIVCWNHWLAKASGRSAESMLGKTFTEAFPDLARGRIMHAVRSALEHGQSSLLSQSLNRAPFDLFRPSSGDDAPVRMQQSIQVTPLPDTHGRFYCLIQIQDVTASVLKEKVLQSRAEELLKFAYQDALTGIPNRRSFEEKLSEEWRRGTRHDAHLGLLMVDVDYFKRYNDILGHQEGDFCLQEVAMALQASLRRPDDMAARYGGEEFVVLLPHTHLQGALGVAQQMLASIRSLARPHPQSEFGVVTVSIGCASVKCSHEFSAEYLLQEADLALYFAKQQGRNQVRVIHRDE